jgi:hypothetical protein
MRAPELFVILVAAGSTLAFDSVTAIGAVTDGAGVEIFVDTGESGLSFLSTVTSVAADSGVTVAEVVDVTGVSKELSRQAMIKTNKNDKSKIL